MKTITIPKKYGFPTLDITVNGKEYTVKSGEEITIEDHIAEAIENAIALAPKLGVPRNKIAQLAEESLTELTAEDLAGISTISNCAFYSCKSLIKVTIPNAITKIGNNAFDWCAGLKTIYLPEIPPEITNANAFGTVKIADRTFYCKSQTSLEAYLSAPIWSEVAALANFAVQ
jgi:hypothetical protein